MKALCERGGIDVVSLTYDARQVRIDVGQIQLLVHFRRRDAADVNLGLLAGWSGDDVIVSGLPDRYVAMAVCRCRQRGGGRRGCTGAKAVLVR